MDKGFYLPIRIACGIIFCIFSLVYFYVYQAEVMAVAQRMASEGKTYYEPITGALLITLVLQLLQMVVYSITQIYKRFYSLTYVPSFLAMLFLVSIFDGDIWYWVWLAPLVLLIWGGVTWTCRLNQPLESKDLTFGFSSGVMLSNLTIMVVMMIAVSIIGSKTEKQYELAHIECVMTDNIRAFTAQRDTIINPNQKAADHLLSQLLIQKRLHEFVHTLPRYYDVTEPIPHIYAEALVLNMSLTRHPQVFWKGTYQGERIDSVFQVFQQRNKEINELKTKKAPQEYAALYEAFRKKYRDTYWYYYTLIDN